MSVKKTTATATTIDYNVVPGNDTNTIIVNGKAYVLKESIVLDSIDTGDLFFIVDYSNTEAWIGDVCMIADDTDCMFTVFSSEGRAGTYFEFDHDSLKQDFATGSIVKITYKELAEKLLEQTIL